MLSSLFEIAARPGGRNLHNLSSGVEPRLFQDYAATIVLIAYTRATLTFGQKRAMEKTALTAEPRQSDFTSLASAAAVSAWTAWTPSFWLT
jgi:hypothetical protein